jgi:hypothetical protein
VNENSDFSLYSMQYSRIVTSIFLLILREIFGPEGNPLITLIYAFLPVFWGFGLISSLPVTLVWIMERWNEIGLGIGQAATDLRTTLLFIVNILVVTIISVIWKSSNLNFETSIFLITTLSTLVSWNILGGLGLSN